MGCIWSNGGLSGGQQSWGGPPAKALEQVSSLDPPLEGDESSGGGLLQGGEGAEALTLGTMDQGLGEAATYGPCLDSDSPSSIFGVAPLCGHRCWRGEHPPESAQGLGITGRVGGPEALRPGWKGQIPTFHVITLCNNIF